MTKLFEFMVFGSNVFVPDTYGWGAEADVPGFAWGDGGLEENELVAQDGASIMFQSTSLRRGNHLQASLRHKGIEVEKVKLGDFFPNQDVVIATCGESLQFFAPICKNKLELVKFLSKLDECCKAQGDELSWHVKEQATQLALWLYRHNPAKEAEPEWGI